MADARTSRSRRSASASTRRPIRFMASSVGISTSPSQSRSTSNSATSMGRSRSSRRFVLAARLTKWTAPGSRGARPGTAIVSRRGTCVESPSASAALHPPGPIPDPPTTSPARRSGGGGAMPSRVGVPRQYSPRRTRRSSPASASRESVFATASGEASKSSGRQKRFLEGRTRVRIAVVILGSLMVRIVPLLSTRRYAKLTESNRPAQARVRSDRGQAVGPAWTPLAAKGSIPFSSRRDARESDHVATADDSPDRRDATLGEDRAAEFRTKNRTKKFAASWGVACQ